jgi:hypothetical protein
LKHTSLSIDRRRHVYRTITAHVAYGGLSPETLDFIAALNAEADQVGTGVRYACTQNRITVSGDIDAAATAEGTLGAEFLRIAAAGGWLESEEMGLRRLNSAARKSIRRFAKTIAGMRARADGEALTYRNLSTRIIAAKGQAAICELLKVVPRDQLLDAGIDLGADQRRPRIPNDLAPHFDSRRPPRRNWTRGATKTSFRQGGPNPRRKADPDT